eukprot:scaffold28506_cov20-Prasinocladus_malaysianus.AAC.1
MASDRLAIMRDQQGRPSHGRSSTRTRTSTRRARQPASLLHWTKPCAADATVCSASIYSRSCTTRPRAWVRYIRTRSSFSYMSIPYSTITRTLRVFAYSRKSMSKLP